MVAPATSVAPMASACGSIASGEDVSVASEPADRGSAWAFGCGAGEAGIAKSCAAAAVPEVSLCHAASRAPGGEACLAGLGHCIWCVNGSSHGPEAQPAELPAALPLPGVPPARAASEKKSLAALLLPPAVLPVDQPYCAGPAVQPSLLHDRFVVQEVDL